MPVDAAQPAMPLKKGWETAREQGEAGVPDRTILDLI
jgi:hypothetical protein